MLSNTIMNIISKKFFEFIIFEFSVLVLFDPLRSADPPINSGKIFEIALITEEEHCLVAIFGFD